MLASERNCDDARSVIISLTVAGKEAFRKIGPTIERRDQELYRCLTEHEREMLRRILDKVLASRGW
jgi:DNA-binding MarR family transcriptional regulator